jgi:hypothetical protein
VDRGRLPNTDAEWADLGRKLLLVLADRSRQERVFDPLPGVLLSLCGDTGEPRTENELADSWFASTANPVAVALPDNELARRLSDRDLHRCLVMFDDCGVWRTGRRLHGTEAGWDFALTLIAAIDNGWFDHRTA